MGTRALLLGVLCLLALLNIAACYGFWGRSRCPYSCVRCSPSGSTRCVQCKAGFKLMYGKTCAVDTSQCAEHCHFCGKNGRNHCDICSRGYILTLKNTCSKDVKCADYCEFCELSGETKCDHCERGYFMTRDRTCVPLIASCAEHCYFCQSNGKHKCDRCYFGYKLTENKTCASIHGECAPNCLTCLRSGKDRCDWCKSGYVMTTKDTCEKKISPCAENCLTCQKNGQKKCDVCYFDYTLTSDKTCARHEQCAAHCFVCFKNGKNKCDLCRHGYTLTLDKTCSTSAKCAEHCHLCLRNGQDKCDVCSSGYTLKLDKTCAKNVKCADHCRSCRFTGESKCDHCDDGYAQTYYKTCIPVKGKPRPGKCPSIPAFAVGICPEACRHDAGCPPDHKCCSTGCGHICKKAVAQTGPCAKHCLSCKENGPQKCDVCERGYKLTKDMNCTSSPLCIEEIEVCLMDWTSVYQQRYDPQSSRSVNTKKLCDLLPEVKDCMEDLRNVCDEDGTWITSMEMLSAYVVNCAPTTGTTTKQSSTTPASSAGGSTKTTTKQSSTTPASSAGRSTKTPTKQSSTTPTSSAGRSTKTPTKLSSTTPASSAVSRSVVMVIRLAKEWKKEYKDFKNTETKELVDLLEVSLHAIFKRVKGFQNVEVKSLFKSSVGVELVVVFDHELTDAERTTLALTLTSALAANNNKLTLGSEDINISGKPEMFVAGEKVEVNGACFLYDKKQLCQNGGSCVAREASARCVCASGYSGMYCNARTSNASTKGRNIVVPVAAGIGVFLLVGIVVLAALLYRKRSAEKQRGTHNPDGGVDNPLYAVYTY